MKKIFFVLLMVLVISKPCFAASRTLYVSSTGNDSNSGTISAPLQTLSGAYSKKDSDTEIIIMDSLTLSLPTAYSGNLSIKGNTKDVVLTLPSSLSLTGNLKLDNITLATESTIYANGYTLEIGNAATSTSRLTVYGGKKSLELKGNTDVKLFGGQYSAVYGGGNNGKVTGDTYVSSRFIKISEKLSQLHNKMCIRRRCVRYNNRRNILYKS